MFWFIIAFISHCFNFIPYLGFFTSIILTTRIPSTPPPQVGAEYGTTTGRPRRVGWLDLAALNFAVRVNGFSHLNLTKLDVLSGLDEIRVGVAYVSPSGERLRGFPASLDLLEKCTVEWETLPGWKTDISGARTWGDLPPAAQAYVRYVEEKTGVWCKWIGVGPGREALVCKPNELPAAKKVAAAVAA